MASVAGQLAALNEMTIGQLKEKYREVFGEPARSRNKPRRAATPRRGMETS